MSHPRRLILSSIFFKFWLRGTSKAVTPNSDPIILPLYLFITIPLSVSVAKHCCFSTQTNILLFLWVFVFMVYCIMLSGSHTTHHWILGCLMIWCGGLLSEIMSTKLFFSLSIINNEYNLGHVYIPISENQTSAVHNSNCMFLDHIYWNFFAGVHLFFHMFQSVCLVSMKWVKEQENFNICGNLYET
jgi:hypothetical protein